jgi:hypothetical protein
MKNIKNPPDICINPPVTCTPQKLQKYPIKEKEKEKEKRKGN